MGDGAQRWEQVVAGLEGQWRLIDVRPLSDDEGVADEATEKGTGYGRPVRLRVEDDGAVREIVVHTARGDEFGHDRRADRAQEMILAYDTFGDIPRHTRALDVGAFSRAGDAHSLSDSGEFYLVTEFVPGTLYADHLRRMATRAALEDGDRRRLQVLVRSLIEIHAKPAPPASYRRAVRDLVGSGEGIFGLIDAMPAAPGLEPERLRAIEHACLDWRWRLRDRASRARRIHGDFHPFNLLFDGDRLALLDASRGSRGDPADDVACLAINFPFFALGHDGAWSAMRELWYGLWRDYEEASGDADIPSVVAPYLAWRVLVLVHPLWYPSLEAAGRDRLLAFAETALAAERFDPELAEDIHA